MTTIEPAIVLYLRGALPGWTVTEVDACPTAVHPDGSRIRWRCKFNSGDPAWFLLASEAVQTKYPQEVELLSMLRPAPPRRPSP